MLTLRIDTKKIQETSENFRRQKRHSWKCFMTILSRETTMFRSSDIYISLLHRTNRWENPTVKHTHKKVWCYFPPRQDHLSNIKFRIALHCCDVHVACSLNTTPQPLSSLLLTWFPMILWSQAMPLTHFAKENGIATIYGNSTHPTSTNEPKPKRQLSPQNPL